MKLDLKSPLIAGKLGSSIRLILVSVVVSAATGLAATKPLFSDMLVAGGLINPTLMATDPDGRIFISQQSGQIRVVKNGGLLATPFLTLNVNAMGERGVLGIAFDPAFRSNQYVYVYYTTASIPHNRLSRFTANGDVAAPGERILLELPTLSSATNHNGGALTFGLDGKLYIAVGDNANGVHSQDMGTVFGKILRINPDGSIPNDNPFYGSTLGNNRAICALGLRNPYTMAMQPISGRMVINDVGLNAWEEINDGILGANYGWPLTEGPTNDIRYKSPLYSYDHISGGCAIIGGAFYNPVVSEFPAEYLGNYFFGDYCSGWIRNINFATGVVTNFATGLGAISHIGIGDDGALYYLDRYSGSLRKIIYTNTSAPRISRQPTDKVVTVGDSVVFTVAASGAPPLQYKWQRNGVDVAGANAASYTKLNAQLSDHGARFRCIVSNTSGSDSSDEAMLSVSSNQPPTALITNPVHRSQFYAGQVIAVAGVGMDAEDGNLANSAYTWEVKLFHNDGQEHSHPFYGPVSGIKSGNLAIPTQGETSPNIWFRIYLTVKDSRGFEARDSVDILPLTVTITLGSSPSGLVITLDGQPHITPYTFNGVVGASRWIGAVSPQSIGAQSWSFQSWPNGKALNHTVSTPASNTVFNAAFAITGAWSFESEAIPTTANIAQWVDYDFRYSSGKATRILSTGPGHYCEWSLPCLAVGRYDVTVVYQRSNSNGTLRGDFDGEILGPDMDMSGTDSFQSEARLGLKEFTSAGEKKLRLTVVGKNAASTGYSMNIDKIVLTPQ